MSGSLAGAARGECQRMVPGKIVPALSRVAIETREMTRKVVKVSNRLFPFRVFRWHLCFWPGLATALGDDNG